MTDIRHSAGGVRRNRFVVVTLREPREKMWGVLDEVADAGVYLRGIDVGSFDELARSASNGEAIFGIGDVFFPLWRIERIAADARSGTIPSLAEEFAARTGFAAADLFERDAAESFDEIGAGEGGDVAG